MKSLHRNDKGKRKKLSVKKDSDGKLINFLQKEIDGIKMKRFIKEKYFNFRYIHLKRFLKWRINLMIRLFNSLYPMETTKEIK